jgi:hypothetical protein
MLSCGKPLRDLSGDNLVSQDGLASVGGGGGGGVGCLTRAGLTLSSSNRLSGGSGAGGGGSWGEGGAAG